MYFKFTLQDLNLKVSKFVVVTYGFKCHISKVMIGYENDGETQYCVKKTWMALRPDANVSFGQALEQVTNR